ncbi:hypothetical protein K449DRAFT_173823 [Hypoxylon sp. EC38]|nr:hypothetical protein K449DRAFT_173823 [Hypoxylon sp. EC38]
MRLLHLEANDICPLSHLVASHRRDNLMRIARHRQSQDTFLVSLGKVTIRTPILPLRGTASIMSSI